MQRKTFLGGGKHQKRDPIRRGDGERGKGILKIEADGEVRRGLREVRTGA